MNSSHLMKRNMLSTAIAAALMASVQTAQAQDQNVDGEGVLEEIIVTATSRETSTQDIPYNISAISGLDISEQNIVNANDLMRTIAGVSVVDRGYRNTGHINSIVIRGLNVDNGLNGEVGLSAAPTVATYVDNIPLYAPFLLKDIQRVEVLRGPQATLYGSGALGGTIRYIMNKPDPTAFAGEVTGTYGQTDGSSGQNLSGDVMLNIPISENAAFRVSGSVINDDGLIDYVNLYELGANGKPMVQLANGSCVDNDSSSLSAAQVAFNDACYTSKEDADTVKITYGRASFLWNATDDLSMQLTWQGQHDKIGGRRSNTNGTDFYGNAYKDDEIGATFLEPSKRDADLFNLDLNYDAGFASLTSNSSYYTHKGGGWRDNTSLWVTDRSQETSFTNWFDILYTGNPRAAAYVEAGFDEDAFVQEIRLVSDNDGSSNWDWIAGAFYMDQNRSTTNVSYIKGLNEYSQACAELGPLCAADGQWWVGGNLSEIDFFYDRREKFKDFALYGELTYHVSDTFRLTGGIRWFDNKLTNETAMDFPLFEGVVVPYEQFPTMKDNDVLFKVNASWDVRDDMMLYATFSQGYRRGGANAVPVDGFFAEPNPETIQFYGADKANNYEIGIKGSSDRIRYSADLFYIDWKDPQLNSTTGFWGFFIAQNGESAVSKGLELEISYAATQNLIVNAGYAYVNAKLTDDLIGPQFGNVISEDGHRLPGVPEHTLSASLDHNYEMNSGWDMNTRLHAYYQSDSINSITDGTTQDHFPSFSLWDASIAFSNDNWTFALYGKNLTNKEGVTGSLPAANQSLDTGVFENFYGNNQRDYITRPRTWTLSATYRF